ncbi:MAG: DUF4330 domain-containing protein [Clostridia bacterium]|nr:DUF4330 domain-containing protein [Clostridia bacterium]
MKAKFNIMDGLIILVLVLAIALGGYLLFGMKKSGEISQNTKVSVTVELKAKDAEFSKLPQIGDKVSIGVKEKMQTVVTEVEALPAKTIGYDTVNGIAMESEVPNKYDVLITVEADGVETNEKVTIDNVAARVGEEAAMKSKNWAGLGYIVAVDTEQK